MDNDDDKVAFQVQEQQYGRLQHVLDDRLPPCSLSGILSHQSTGSERNTDMAEV